MKGSILVVVVLPFFLMLEIDGVKVVEVDNSIFKQDRFWRGADGGATVALDSGKILWLFSDTFIDQDGSGKRSNAKVMIRNSIAIQDCSSLNADLKFHYKGTRQKPEDFFLSDGEDWFWTGHGILLDDDLVVFLMEITSTNTGLGFEAVGWWVAIVNNPSEDPDRWNIKYFKGPPTFGVIAGSSAVLEEGEYIYTFAVKEPATHETYLIRFEKSRIINGDLSNLQWWVDQTWTTNVNKEPRSSSLFLGQTEFSVHFDDELNKYIQIQTYGFGKASIGYRLADQLQGPWSEPVLFYTPTIEDEGAFVYTANAHPEFKSDKLIITYNINHADFEKLIHNEAIYFPRIIKLRF